MMFDRHERSLCRIDAEIAHKTENPPAVAAEVAVAVEQGVQGPVRGVPVAPGEMAAARVLEEADLGKREGDKIDLVGFYAGKLEAEAGGMKGPPVLGVLVTDKTLLLGRRHEFTVDQQGGRGVVGQGSRKS